MSTFQAKNIIGSSKLPGSESASVTPPPGPDGPVSSGVCEELGRLAEFMPDRYREVFCFRWGLRGEFSHVISQVARKFALPKPTVEEMLNRCLWNIARHAHAYELPALHGMLGEDRERWPERAWAHAQRRWGNQDSAFSEAVLLLSVAGVDVPEAHWLVRGHMVDLGLGRGNRWARPLRGEELTQAMDRMLALVIWPADTAALSGLDEFCVRRPLGVWGPCKSGGVSERQARAAGAVRLRSGTGRPAPARRRPAGR